MHVSTIFGAALFALSQAAPTPPNIPTAASAKTLLSSLTVAAQTTQDGYSRSLFPHWITQVCKHNVVGYFSDFFKLSKDKRLIETLLVWNVRH